MEHRFGAAILAAGMSSRMGRPKLLLPWGQYSVLEHLVHQWQELRATQLAVVLSSENGPVAQELNRMGFPAAARILNPRAEAGMFSSIQCAADWTGWRTGIGHVAVALGDQPHLRTATLRRLLEFASRHPEEVCQPGQAGKAYHPVLLPWAEFRRMIAAKTPDLRGYLLSCRVALCDVDDPGLTLDLDTPAEYEAALRMAFPQ